MKLISGGQRANCILGGTEEQIVFQGDQGGQGDKNVFQKGLGTRGHEVFLSLITRLTLAKSLPPPLNYRTELHQVFSLHNSPLSHRLLP